MQSTPPLACQRDENKSVVNRSSVDRGGLLESHLVMMGRTGWSKRRKDTDNSCPSAS